MNNLVFLDTCTMVWLRVYHTKDYGKCEVGMGENRRMGEYKGVCERMVEQEDVCG